ncbi:D-2-hydroxyacid dehydrogenase [Falsiroseomonas sp. HW251]|uniref:D-2-hydroxyacid dehydrogenase n=1 Tax=Falsiroseomonas sp. HW251 TaxID=3390998 RepID=UPI003D31567E
MERILISSPLEAEHVERIRAVDPAGIEVLYAPDLLPPTRYRGDHKGAPFTRSDAQRQRWQAMARDATISWDIPSAEDLAVMDRLRWIQGTSTGIGQHAKRLGLDARDILMTTARGVHARPLAEFVFMALLAHWRGLAHLQAEQRAHRWERYCTDEVAGKTLVILGAGDLARGAAKVAKAFEMTVVAVTRDPSKSRAHGHLFDEVVPTAALHAALARADALLLTVPHTPETERIIDAKALAALRPGAVFINIGRGQIVDEPALIEALRSGRIGFAALDVTEVEPLPVDSPLWNLPNVLISPHSASTPPSENARITDLFIHNLRCWLAGDRAGMKNLLDKQLMY